MGRTMCNMVHVSFDLVDEFVPRVPKQRLDAEDGTIKRICVAPDIRSALQSIPWCGNVITTIRKLGMPVIIHAYYLKSRKVVSNKEVQLYVADAHLTGEVWIIGKPDKVIRRDYELFNIATIPRVDVKHGVYEVILSTEMKRVKNQDNWQNLMDATFGDEEHMERLSKLRSLCSYRTLMSNLDEEQIEILKERIRLNERISDILAGTGRT